MAPVGHLFIFSLIVQLSTIIVPFQSSFFADYYYSFCWIWVNRFASENNLPLWAFSIHYTFFFMPSISFHRGIVVTNFGCFSCILGAVFSQFFFVCFLVGVMVDFSGGYVDGLVILSPLTDPNTPACRVWIRFIFGYWLWNKIVGQFLLWGRIEMLRFLFCLLSILL